MTPPDEKCSHRQESFTRLAVFYFFFLSEGPPEGGRLDRCCVHHFGDVVSHDRTNSKGVLWIEMSTAFLVRRVQLYVIVLGRRAGAQRREGVTSHPTMKDTICVILPKKNGQRRGE